MTDTTNPEMEVETTDQAPEIESTRDDASGFQPRDEKGRFANKQEGETATDSPPEPGEEELVLDPTDIPEDELEEVEYDGKRYSVPKTIKDGIMRHADYTRKTQEISAQRKQYEEALAAHQQTIKEHTEEFEERAALHAMHNYLESIRTTDWAKAIAEDPISANQRWIEYQQLKDQFQERAVKIQTKQQERTLQAQRESAKRTEEGRLRLQREIKDWSPAMEATLSSYAKQAGVPNADNLEFALYPEQTKVLHKAYLYDQLLKRAQQKPKQPEPKPIKTLGQSAPSSPSRLDDDLPVDEWLKRREAQLKRK